MALQVARHRFTVDEFHRMSETGVLGEDDRVELLDGEIVDMTPIGSRHAGCVKSLNALLTSSLGRRAIVAVQDPVVLGPRSEPQPDLLVLRFRPDFYRTSHPRPEDVLLAIEVAETSLEFERTVKLPLYARAGLPEVWLVDLAGQTIAVHRDPAGSAYRRAHHASRGERVAPEAFPDLSLAVDDILG